MLNAIWEWLAGDRASTILAGSLGGLVRWITLKENFRDGVASILVGGIAAAYLTPLVLPAMTPVIGSFVGDEANRAGFSGFIIGIAGITVTGFLIDFFRKWSRNKLHDPQQGEAK